MYIAVSIGNSDDKLTQKQWNRFCEEMDIVLSGQGKIHFHGGPPNSTPWQNAAWIVEIPVKIANTILVDIANVRHKYGQDSAFVMVGNGLFV